MRETCWQFFKWCEQFITKILQMICWLAIIVLIYDVHNLDQSGGLTNLLAWVIVWQMTSRTVLDIGHFLQRWSYFFFRSGQIHLLDHVILRVTGDLGASSHPCVIFCVLWPLGGSVLPPEPTKQWPLCPHVSSLPCTIILDSIYCGEFLD